MSLNVSTDSPPDLEDEIISYIENSSIVKINAAGKSYINCWCPVHFTMGKYSQHLTIQENTLQCIHAFLHFGCTNYAQTQLFYQFVKASPKERTKALQKSIIRSIDQKAKLKPNVHFEEPDGVDDADGDSKQNENDGSVEGTLKYELENCLETMPLIQAKSPKIHQALLSSVESYFVDLNENHGLNIPYSSAMLWQKQ